MNFTNKHVLVVGMARSGIAAAELLLKLGANVTLYDSKQADVPAELLCRCQSLMGIDPLPYVDSMDLLVLSPGVPPRLPFIQRALSLSIRVIAEMELGFLCSRADFVAISGTNGKTTTTALTGEIFAASGRPTHVLGNIGVPICEKALETKSGDVIVAETAALQLETIQFFHPKAAALLNLTEDHLDRFLTMDRYCVSKLRMFENQTEDDVGVLNYDNELCHVWAPHVKGRLLWFSIKEEVKEGAFLRNGRIVFRYEGQETDICHVKEVRIPGMHNIENALAAICLSAPLGVPYEAIRSALREFPGVAHRIEFIREANGVRYYNDSKGTNPDATEKAILAMDRPTVLILGGYDKHLSFEHMFSAFTPLIRGVVLLGQTADQLEETAARAGFKNVSRVETFSEAIDRARDLCKPGWNVLLSPACASWGMFQNFEQRGDLFREHVLKY